VQVCASPIIGGSLENTCYSSSHQFSNLSIFLQEQSHTAVGKSSTEIKRLSEECRSPALYPGVSLALKADMRRTGIFSVQ